MKYAVEDLAPKKSLGQHFLTNKSYLRAIVDALEIDVLEARPREIVIEIGPGKGSLTAELLSRNAKVIALEKDRRLIPFLEEKFSQEIKSGQLRIIEVDALDFGLTSNQLPVTSYQLVGNIPYYITGALLSKFLTEKNQPSTIVFLVQKEVAERIARSKKESLLSLSVKAYGTPKFIKTIPAGAFSPPPKVDSAILAITDISRKNFKNTAYENRFFEIIRAGFAHKRKLLVRNLETVFGKQSANALAKAHIPERARAEDLPLEKWLELQKHTA